MFIHNHHHEAHPFCNINVSFEEGKRVSFIPVNDMNLWNVSFVTFEPLRGKTNNVVSEQVRHNPTCTATEKS